MASPLRIHFSDAYYHVMNRANPGEAIFITDSDRATFLDGLADSCETYSVKLIGYKRARWRRLWRVQIQEYLTASVQNIMVLLRNSTQPEASLAMVRAKSRHHISRLELKQLSFYFKQAVPCSIKQFFASRCYEARICVKYCNLFLKYGFEQHLVKI